MPTVDLHTHSTASDGSTPPGDLGALAAAAGLAAIALTDHDTTAGHAACAVGCQAAGVEFVPGIEVSCERGRPTGSMHILGYFVDTDAPSLAKVAAELRLAREKRVPEIVEKLRALSLDVTVDDIRNHVGESMIGRPHIAEVLVQKKYARSIKDAFDRYIGQGGDAYVRKDSLPTWRAIRAIHDAGGLAVLAHPIQLRCDDDAELEQTVRKLVEQGLDGLEARHSDHSPELVDRYEQLARRFDLVTTGGSDFHGERKSIALGSQNVDAGVLEALRQAHARRG